MAFNCRKIYFYL